MESNEEETRHLITFDERMHLALKVFGLQNMKSDNNWFLNCAIQMVWNTLSLRKLMFEYHNIVTDEDNPNYQFVEKLKELFSIVEKAKIEKFMREIKIYDLYPLRNVLEDSNQGTNRFNMEEMADAGEAYGELLDLILQDLAMLGKQKKLKEIVGIPLEKHYTWVCGKKQVFPYDESCMMLILIWDIFISEYSVDETDDVEFLENQQGRLPEYITNHLTKELDFHQKEHLREWKYQPEDWKYKTLRIKNSDSQSSRSQDACPDVISINLTWQQSSPKDVLTTLNMIPSIFQLSNMFEISKSTENKKYYFKGMIWYWGLHYFWFIRHITRDGEYWMEFNDKEVFIIPNWCDIVNDWVINWATPTLLIFENIDTVEYPDKISDLSLSSGELEELKIKWFKNTRAARMGRVDLGSSKESSKYNNHSFHKKVSPHGQIYGHHGCKYSTIVTQVYNIIDSHV